MRILTVSENYLKVCPQEKKTWSHNLTCEVITSVLNGDHLMKVMERMLRMQRVKKNHLHRFYLIPPPRSISDPLATCFRPQLQNLLTWKSLLHLLPTQLKNIK
ncbi:hypothetical protein ATANTOWER_005464 [Ataeniobius toweri]|uniref:Uncharacterized protein n=1 Tax=Ataeniobius toweri TaxID=208326 RepID=A0ABU7BZY0_9TELE|nr:hypothetical protein [Ataeniobius toweri]